MPNHRSRGSYRRDRNAAQKTVIDWTPRFVVAMVAFFCMAAYELTLNLMQSADLIILKGWPAVTDGDTLVVQPSITSCLHHGSAPSPDSGLKIKP